MSQKDSFEKWECTNNKIVTLKKIELKIYRYGLSTLCMYIVRKYGCTPRVKIKIANLFNTKLSLHLFLFQYHTVVQY